MNNDIREQIEAVTTATGALAEMTYSYYKGLIGAGATKEEADQLTKVFIKSVLEMERRSDA
jgi:hypothetical protein